MKARENEKWKWEKTVRESEGFKVMRASCQGKRKARKTLEQKRSIEISG